MKIFMSWSGELSRKLGEAFRDWIPNVLQFAQPYFTPEDIKKGERWGNEIAKELAASEFGILCVTSDNLNSGWMLFEAGCLSKNLESGMVCPILFNIKPIDLTGPLQQFQATNFSEADVKKLLLTMNGCLKESRLTDAVFTRAFDKWWPDLKNNVDEILSQHSKTTKKTPTRTERDILEEILTILRSTPKTEQLVQQVCGEDFSNENKMLLRQMMKVFVQLHNFFEKESYIQSEMAMSALKEMYNPLKLLVINSGLANRRDNYSPMFFNLSFKEDKAVPF